MARAGRLYALAGGAGKGSAGIHHRQLRRWIAGWVSTFAADVRNYPKTAWETLTKVGGVAMGAGSARGPYRDGWLSDPTRLFQGAHRRRQDAAGGRRAGRRLNRQTGFTLWITPTRAIYQQTKDALWSREHPYRQMLERAAVVRSRC